MEENKKKDSPFTLPPIIVIAFIIIIVVWLTRFFKINYLKEEREKTKRRHDKIEALIDKHEKLKIKLEKSFKISYLILRVFLVLIVIVFNLILYYQFDVKNIRELTAWNNMVLLVFSMILFIAFGSIINISKAVDYMKDKVEKWVYGKYINIPERLVQLEGNKELTIEKMNEIDKKLDELEENM